MNENYHTTDLAIAAYLLCVGEKIKSQTETPSGRAKFIFDGDSERIEKRVLEYHNGEKVSGKSLMDCLRRIKIMAMPND